MEDEEAGKGKATDGAAIGGLGTGRSSALLC